MGERDQDQDGSVQMAWYHRENEGWFGQLLAGRREKFPGQSLADDVPGCLQMTAGHWC